MTELRHPALDLSPARKWLITITVMLITVMQILDTSTTNVAHGWRKIAAVLSQAAA